METSSHILIENNGYGLSTPVDEQYACKNLSDRAHGYGIEGMTIDGNDIELVYDTISNYGASIRKIPDQLLLRQKLLE